MRATSPTCGTSRMRPNYTVREGRHLRLRMRCGHCSGQYGIDGVIHLAAESHVDRSIRDPFTFARTNVLGTLSLLEAAREYWNGEWAGQTVLPHLHRRGVRRAGADPSRGGPCGRGERRRALRRGVLHRGDEVRRRTAPTRRRRLRPTTSCGPTTTRTGCRRW